MNVTSGNYELAAMRDNHFYVSFSEENHCEPHFHDCVEIIISFDDDFVVTINGEEHVLNYGDIAVISGFDIHCYAYQNKKTFVAVIGSSYCSRFFRMHKGKTFPKVLRYDKAAFDEFSAILHWFCDQGRFANELVCRGFSYVMFGTLEKYYPLIEMKRRTDVMVVIELMNDICENYAQNITLEGYARQYGYSKTYLSALFNTYTGMHFRDYINRVRVEVAKKLMNEKENTKDTMLSISMKCGFDNPSTFYRALKKFGA